MPPCNVYSREAEEEVQNKDRHGNIFPLFGYLLHPVFSPQSLDTLYLSWKSKVSLMFHQLFSMLELSLL